VKQAGVEFKEDLTYEIVMPNNGKVYRLKAKDRTTFNEWR
jgi:hypothetical protein